MSRRDSLPRFPRQRRTTSADAPPKPPKMPLCGRTHTGPSGKPNICIQFGDHFCEPRADHVCAFIEELLVHTKGRHARQPFLLRPWQRDEIIRPLFGHVVWSDEHQRYVRKYRIAYLEMSRKNGKTAILAAMMLYLLFGDGEEGGEIFSVARDRNQASMAFDMASRMVRLSPVLSAEAKVVASVKRIVRQSTNSVYRVIASDAGSALGSNPSGVAADEILAWPKPDIWDALRSGMGSSDRTQPLMVAATTAPGDDGSFGFDMHHEMLRVMEDPERAPHIFVWIRNLPVDVDIYDERNWYIPNPALGDFLSLEEMRRMAVEAANDPMRELAFRRYQLNQMLSSTVAWMDMPKWDACAGDHYTSLDEAFAAFEGASAWMGVDLAARQDMTSICYVLPAGDGTVDVLWRHFLPQVTYDRLNRATSGKMTPWGRDGWLTVTDGDVLDFNVVYDAIEADAKRFEVLGIDADRWSSDPVLQEIGSRTFITDVMAYSNDFTHMSDGMHRVSEMVTDGAFRHHGNPVARWCFQNCEARMNTVDPDLIAPAKIDRRKTERRIDAASSAIMAVTAWWSRGRNVESVYQDNDLMVL